MLLWIYSYLTRFIPTIGKFLLKMDSWFNSWAHLHFIPLIWKLAERLNWEKPPAVNQKRYWFHCASLGEAKGLFGLLTALNPQVPVLVTGTSSQAVEWLRAQGLVSAQYYSCYPPLDQIELMNKFLEEWNIQKLCLYEMELWPNLLKCCNQRNIPVILVSARLRVEAFSKLLFFTQFATQLVSSLSWIQTQSTEDRDRFRTFAKCPVETGFDFKALTYLTSNNTHIDSPPPNSNGIAFLSIHPDEFRFVSQACRLLGDKFTFYVVPRFPSDSKKLSKHLSGQGFVNSSSGLTGKHYQVNQLGQIPIVLAHCKICVMGGSIGKIGCHNLWEPLVAFQQIFLGPNLGQQKWLGQQLLNSGIAISIQKPEDLVGAAGLTHHDVVQAKNFLTRFKSLAWQAVQRVQEKFV